MHRLLYHVERAPGAYWMRVWVVPTAGLNAVARKRNTHTKFWLGKLQGKDHSQDLGAYVKVILEWFFDKTVGEDVEWIHLAQDRNLWRAVVNRTMIRVL
jgi:hypothetical protein